jgi:hypothetical protein
LAPNIKTHYSPNQKHSLRFLWLGEIRGGPPYFELEIDGKKVPQRTVGFDFCWHPEDRYLAVQEWAHQEVQRGPHTYLLLIDLKKWTFRRMAEARSGFICLEKFEQDQLYYRLEDYAAGKTEKAQISI